MLAGCELFSAVDLQGCPDNSLCTGETDTDTDTDTDTHTDSDTDTDTDIGPPTHGIICGEADGFVAAMDAEGEIHLAREDVPRVTGALAYDHVAGLAYVPSGTELLRLAPEAPGDLPPIPLPDQVVDVLLLDGTAFLGFLRSGVARIEPDSTLGWLLEPTDVVEVSALAHGPAETLYVVDLDDGSPDVLVLSADGSDVQTALEDIDSSSDRSRYAFTDQDEDLWVCSRAGAATRAETLSSGNKEPEILPEVPLFDVVGCDYDTGSHQLLLISAEEGLLRVDGDGSTEVVHVPGNRIVYGSGWTVPE